jgi:PAS domain S-box-containing protein
MRYSAPIICHYAVSANFNTNVDIILLRNAVKRFYNQVKKPMSKKKGESPDTPKTHTFTGANIFNAVFDKIQTGIIIIDSETHTIVEANSLAEKILGFSKDKLVGRVCHDYICPSKTGSCPITDLHKSIDNSEKEMINAEGKKVPVLKTQVSVVINKKEHILESFVDFSDHVKAQDRKVVLIGYLSESVHRVRRPLELTQMNLQLVADQVKTGEFDPEEIRMELQIQANNIGKIIKNLEDLTESVTKERNDIPPEFQEFFARK